MQMLNSEPEQDMTQAGPKSAFWTAFMAGLAAPASLYNEPKPIAEVYLPFVAVLSPAEAFSSVAAFLNASMEQNVRQFRAAKPAAKSEPARATEAA